MGSVGTVAGAVLHPIGVSSALLLLLLVVGSSAATFPN